METFSSVDLSTKLGRVIDIAMASPVLITRYRRPCVVILNATEYDRLTALDTATKEDKGS
jgi:PHD/YefM family antitoxin component YafN of YafNO toxin-antitoxin module